MYSKIRKTPGILQKYSEKLIAEGVVTEQEFKVRWRWEGGGVLEGGGVRGGAECWGRGVRRVRDWDGEGMGGREFGLINHKGSDGEGLGWRGDGVRVLGRERRASGMLGQ